MAQDRLENVNELRPRGVYCILLPDVNLEGSPGENKRKAKMIWSDDLWIEGWKIG
jgi:hypothetical protein